MNEFNKKKKAPRAHGEECPWKVLLSTRILRDNFCTGFTEVNK